MHHIIFPSSPLSKKSIAPFWEKEARAAEAAGFAISLASDPNLPGPLSLTNKTGESYLYRGWIVKPPYYQELCQVADQPMLTSYENYLYAYEFPRWYCSFDYETPKSFVYTAPEIQKLGLSEIAEQVSKQVGSQPLLIKDWLKSRKHEWYDACFIKDASDVDECIRIMTNFFNLQGRDFYGGLVFREFLSLKQAGVHPQSGMPLPLEFRTFFLHQKPMMTTMYWRNDVAYPADVQSPPQEWLEEIGKKMESPFVALDIAQSVDGKWWVIEVNDGGSAGYPEHVDSKEFYSLILQTK